MFNDPEDKRHIRRIAVIGSGIAGLTVAHRLQALNLEVTVFEKSRGPGGRLAAKRLPTQGDHSGSADIGAQYFTIRNPDFRHFLDKHAGTDTYQEWPATLRYQCQDGCWEGFRPATRYVGSPRMTAITRALSTNLNIRYETRIGSMACTDNGEWQLMDTEGQHQGLFDAIIVTAPPAQARDFLEASGMASHALELQPHIEKMQACWTVVVHFKDSLGLDYQGMQPYSDILQWAANNSSKPGRQDNGEWWVLHGKPDWSDVNQNASSTAVTDSLLNAFQLATGCLQPPETTLAHRWLYAKSSSPTGPGHLWFAESQVGVIGDWLHGGRVEGAFESAESFLQQWRASDHVG
ncbi:NAD(P)/FAD-dependent oxidoreductase [Marinobacter caseinilyticus]|uniref:NAD(P)/FAD-dependent oxidoreductase n=1 Tax=Marinobacter caseinilyticus TaxID=2692195 RepID=UPI001409AFB6|nr:FAD-dependent oxidoreductase [Marinobacter caseinilyticus]